MQRNSISSSFKAYNSKEEELSVLSCLGDEQRQNESSFLELFDFQVNSSPNRIAVMANGTSLSYQNLWLYSNNLAIKLIRHGVSKGDLVALMLDRSPNILIGMLAIMRAGATYVPIDPVLPQKRINLILWESKPKVVLCDVLDSDFIDQSGVASECYLAFKDINLVDQAEIDSFQSINNKLAYVIFTSGSTGKPKGVQISHAALTSFLLAMKEMPGCNENDVVASVTSISFDISGLELLLPLISGARVSIFNKMDLYDSNCFSSKLITDGITFIQATPATFRLLVSQEWQTNTKLKKILCGGEVLSKKLSLQLLERTNELWNMYGPTESTIWSTIKKIRCDEGSNNSPSIGLPIPGTVCFIINANNQLVQRGQVGELCIAGLGLASGYLNNEAYTEERFVNIPDIASRMYKTGDRALINKDGELEYLGRLDYQVKIRGHRVELPEIEVLARTLDSVDEIAVLAKEDPYGELCLHAFICSSLADLQAVQSVKVFLTEHLPEYMLPSTYTCLSVMPLNTSGKVDRHFLANTIKDRSSEEALSEFDSASENLVQSDLDRLIYKCWCKVLGEEVSPNTHFFEAGGHSISSLVMITHIEKLAGRAIPLSTIFKYPILADFINSVRRSSSQSVSIKVPLNQAAKTSRGNETLYFICGVNLYQDIANALPQSMEAYAIYVEEERDFLEGSKNQDGRPFILKDLAARYVDVILKSNHRGKLQLCGLSFGGILAYEISHQLEFNGVKVERLYLLDSMLPRAYNKRWFAPFMKALSVLTDRLKLIYNGFLNEQSGDSTIIDEFEKKISRRQDNKLRLATERSQFSGTSYDGEILLIKAKDHSDFNGRVAFKEDYAWREHIGRAINVCETEGSHIGMTEGENGKAIAKVIYENSSMLK